MIEVICEAVIRQHVAQRGVEPEISYDEGMPGLRLRPTGQLGIVEATVDCSRCKIHLGFESEGPGYTANNDSDQRISNAMQNCPVLLAEGLPSGQIPPDRLPRVNVT